MNLYSIKQYLRYSWKAKGRHGVHSPFVYAFIEHVLMDRDIIPGEYIVSYPGLPLRFENILSRIAAYYQYREILYLPGKQEAPFTGKADMLLLSEDDPEQWPHIFSKYSPVIKNESIAAVAGIHKSRDHALMWKTLCNDPKVRMSIDMYGMGLLLFREEFKERQHFVLKY